MNDKALLMHEIYGIETANEYKNLEEDKFVNFK